MKLRLVFVPWLDPAEWAADELSCFSREGESLWLYWCHWKAALKAFFSWYGHRGGRESHSSDRIRSGVTNMQEHCFPICLDFVTQRQSGVLVFTKLKEGGTASEPRIGSVDQLLCPVHGWGLQAIGYRKWADYFVPLWQDNSASVASL